MAVSAHDEPRISGEKTEVDSRLATPPERIDDEKPVFDAVTPVREGGDAQPVLDGQDEASAPENDTTAASGDTTVYPKGLTLVFIIMSLCLAIFLVALDQTIIAPALGAITADFDSTKDIVSLRGNLI
jgi:hypothetical protein